MAKWLLSRNLFIGRPWIFFFVILIGTFVISIAVGAVGAVFIISGILYTMCEEIGYEKGNSFPAYLLAGVCIAGVLSFAASPWLGQILLGIMTLDTVSGGTCAISYAAIMIVALPLCLITIAFYTLLVRFVFRPDVAPMTRLTPDYLKTIEKSMHINTEQKIAATALIVFMLFMLIPGFCQRKLQQLTFSPSFPYLLA